MRGAPLLRGDLVAFLVRPHELMPNLAISLVDTELRMQDNVMSLLEDALARRRGSDRAGPRRTPAVTRLLHEIFLVDGSVVLTQALGTRLWAHFARY